MTPDINVYVHLATAQDAESWKTRYDQKALVGINDQTPYGYARADAMGCRVSFSGPAEKGRMRTLARLALRGLLGFDYLHARASRQKICAADVIWTYTELQFLGAAAVLSRLPKGAPRPKLIGQSVWLFDHWRRLSPVHRWLFRRLIRHVDVLTVHSPDNHRIAQDLFPHARVELVLFGIPNETAEAPRPRPADPIRVLCLGNDRDRDWKTAIAALGGEQGIDLMILSTTASPSLASGRSNVTITGVKSNDELKRHLREATLMLVPLKENTHASGITAMQEAALFALPVIATDTGGLRAYFDDRAVRYVRPYDREHILSAVRGLAADPQARLQQAERAQARVQAIDMGCAAFVRRHVELSHELLGRPTPTCH